jgi:ABC-type multidrug transport system permease subunit
MSLILVWAIAFIIWGIQVEASQVIPFFVMLLLTALSSAGIISCFYAVGSRTQATVILPAVILIFALIGGGVVPFQVLPDFLEQFSVVSPIYWSAHGFQTILMGSSINGIIKHIVILGIISVCLISAPVLIQRRRAIQ